MIPSNASDWYLQAVREEVRQPIAQVDSCRGRLAIELSGWRYQSLPDLGVCWSEVIVRIGSVDYHRVGVWSSLLTTLLAPYVGELQAQKLKRILELSLDNKMLLHAATHGCD
jgi:hypothetical protein